MIIHKDERYEFINNEVGRKFRDDFIKKLKSQNIIVNEYEDKLKIVINVTYTNITITDESIMELD